jgi:hypothetical protein
MARSNFAQTNVYHRIVSPFTQAAKFFEQDHVTLCHVYLARKDHFREQERSQRTFNPEYAVCCPTVLFLIQQRGSKLLDRNLLKAAFWLTSLGCQSLSDNKLFISLAYRLPLEELDSVDSANVSFEIHRQVDGSLQFFFCNPESIAKYRNTPGDLDTQVASAIQLILISCSLEILGSNWCPNWEKTSRYPIYSIQIPLCE